MLQSELFHYLVTLITLKEAREEAGETSSLAWLIPETEAPGPPEGEFGMFKRLVFPF